MDRNALAELLQALESRRDAEERRREERYTALIERTVKHTSGAVDRVSMIRSTTTLHKNLCLHRAPARLPTPRTGDRVLCFCSGLCPVYRYPRAVHIVVYRRGFIYFAVTRPGKIIKHLCHWNTVVCLSLLHRITR
ncbi:UNVERIFIED_CONTAM: hypothetical protein FKN15_068965 [Acipenser sinensis]